MKAGGLSSGKKIRRGFLIWLIFASAVNLCGCEMAQQMQELFPEEEEAPQITTLTAKKDGTISETIVDVFDQGYYDTQELKALIDQTVSDFGAEFGAQALTVDSYQAEEGKILLSMTYAGPDAYAAYNHVPFFNGPMLEAQVEGFMFLNDFRRVKGKEVLGETISNAEPLSHKEYQVLVTDMSHAVKVPGKVIYLSANANMADGGLIIPVNVQEDKEEGLLLPSSAVYVKEKGSTQLSEAELEKTYVYIIYDA